MKVDPSLNVPTALNCCVDPRLMLALLGVTAIETSVALVTVSGAVPTFPANNAETTVLPGAMQFATPWLPMALLIVATEGADDVHDTTPVKSRVSPLANTPVAVNPASKVSGMVTLAGDIWIEDKVDPSTTTPAVALIAPDWALMVAVPADCPVTTPDEKTVATSVFDDVHVTAPFMGCWLPSLKVPVALYPVVEPGDTIALAGDTASDTRVAELTVNVEKPVTPPKLALMFAVPGPTPVTVRGPRPPPLPSVATDVLLDVQLQLPVITWVVESENSPVAVKLFCPPTGTVTPVGVTEIDEMVALVTVRFVVPLTVPKVAVMMVVPELVCG